MTDIDKITKTALGVVHAAQDIASHIVDNIANMVRPLGDKIENHLKEKGVTNITRELRSGNEINNVIAEGNGNFHTDNSSDVMRKLLNCVLFSVDGEKRVNDAMAKESSNFLKKIEMPHEKIHATNATSLAPKNLNHEQ